MDTPKTIPFPVHTESITDRYQKLNAENPTPEQLQEFIAIESDRADEILAADEDDPISELMAEALIFVVTFMQDYGENEAVKNHIGSIWPKWPAEPTLIQIGMEMLEDISDGFPFKQNYPLNEKQTRQFNAILAYMRGFDQTRFVTIICNDEEGDTRDEQFCFDKEMEQEDMDSMSECLEYWLKACFANGGAMVMRVYRQDNGEKDMVFGFQFINNEALVTKPDELKRCMETMPDGSVLPEPNATYQIPFINLN